MLATVDQKRFAPRLSPSHENWCRIQYRLYAVQQLEATYYRAGPVGTEGFARERCARSVYTFLTVPK